MLHKRCRPWGRVLLSIAGFAAVFANSQVADAQAWVPDKGALGATASYQYSTGDVILEDGTLEFVGNDTYVQTVALGLSYTPIDRLGLGISVPLMFLRYGGEFTSVFPGHGSYDDGASHATLQDFRFDARYQILDDDVIALTPLVGFSIPMADYPVIGFTAPGRGLKQLHLGLNAARTLDPWVPNLYFHANYEFAVVESFDEDASTSGISQNNSRFGLQVGYFFGEKVQAYGRFDGVLYHGGVEFVDWNTLTRTQKNFHDPILKERGAFVGGGLGYQATDQIGVGLGFVAMVWGRNTRKVQVVSLNLSFDLDTAAADPALDPDAEGVPEA